MDEKLEDQPAGRQGKKEEEKTEEENQEAMEETPIVPSPPDSDQETEAIPREPYTPVSKKRNWKKLIYLLGFVLVVLILFQGFRALTGSGKTTPSPTPTSTSTSTPTPTIEESSTPTPTPTSSIDKATGLDRADLTVLVQNGSGEAGVAKKASDFLKNLGYNVVSTGNADNFNYTDVTVKVKSSVKKYLSLLVKDLSSDYTVGSSSSDLSASASADALVIIGK